MRNFPLVTRQCDKLKAQAQAQDGSAPRGPSFCFRQSRKVLFSLSVTFQSTYFPGSAEPPCRWMDIGFQFSTQILPGFILIVSPSFFPGFRRIRGPGRRRSRRPRPHFHPRRDGLGREEGGCRRRRFRRYQGGCAAAAEGNALDDLLSYC